MWSRDIKQDFQCDIIMLKWFHPYYFNYLVISIMSIIMYMIMCRFVHFSVFCHNFLNTETNLIKSCTHTLWMDIHIIHDGWHSRHSGCVAMVTKNFICAWGLIITFQSKAYLVIQEKIIAFLLGFWCFYVERGYKTRISVWNNYVEMILSKKKFQTFYNMRFLANFVTSQNNIPKFFFTDWKENFARSFTFHISFNNTQNKNLVTKHVS